MEAIYELGMVGVSGVVWSRPLGCTEVARGSDGAEGNEGTYQVEGSEPRGG